MEYPVRAVEIPICGELYQKWSETRSLYKNIPAEGILTKIEYADTLYCKDSNGKEITTESPIVVCLHGAPGSHQDYRHLIKDLTLTGHRVIVPNFPSKFLCLVNILSMILGSCKMFWYFNVLYNVWYDDSYLKISAVIDK